MEENKGDDLSVGPSQSTLFQLNHLKGFGTKANFQSVKITELIEPTAKSAILTTYHMDLEWLLSTCPVLKNIPVMLIHSHKGYSYDGVEPRMLHMKQPPLPVPYGLCHGKIMLIKYESFLRVVVSTANLTDSDYHRKTQGIWHSDFPKIFPKGNEKKRGREEEEEMTDLAKDFVSTLRDYITRLGVNDTEFLDDYSFNSVNILLVTSVPGYHKKKDIEKYGHMKLRKWLAKFPLDDDLKNSPITAQFSSIGSLSRNWVSEFITSFSEYSDKEKNDTPNLDIVWPDVEFVRECIDGYSAGGSLCFPEKSLKSFMKDDELFHHYVGRSGRERVPPHIKTYCRSIPLHDTKEASTKKEKKEKKKKKVYGMRLLHLT
eukprot:TRINITY_DN445_c0_g2_i1.p1 TRINITY_DN445_c0_g2~~TRINITY_DN445_c0_g2_i1.p1  ORF type:complete len:404 (+),score=70.64 TRINITY_DN445_c0_g2_i1:94-1212(+)